MTADRRAALVAKVKELLSPYGVHRVDVNFAIDIIRAEVLEEAARVVDGLDNCDCHDCQIRKEKAAAIRNLKGAK